MENIPGTDRLGPGDMEMADIIGIEWNERLHNTAGWAGTNVGTHITHYFHFQQSRERESPCPSRVGPYPYQYTTDEVCMFGAAAVLKRRINRQKHAIFLL